MTAETFLIDVDGAGHFRCPSTTNALNAMERAGHRLVPIGCRGGGCGVCKVRVVEGRYITQRMSTSRISPEERADGFALFCRLLPLSDLRVIPQHQPLPQSGFTVRAGNIAR